MYKSINNQLFIPKKVKEFETHTCHLNMYHILTTFKEGDPQNTKRKTEIPKFMEIQ